jgi:hypothetical protein
MFVEGTLVSSTYEQPNGKCKKSKTAKITSWSISADVVRKLAPTFEQDPKYAIRLPVDIAIKALSSRHQ